MTNNAVATAATPSGTLLLSFLGLGPGRAWQDAVDLAHAWRLDSHEAVSLPRVPGPGGRLGAVAVTVGGRVVIFGGYTVGEGTEKSAPDVFAFDPVTSAYSALAPMPLPVDDTVALSYQDRYVYLISGWHDTNNVDLVQVLDVRENRWFTATAFPGSPVFGHAGGIVGGRFVVCDGVRLTTVQAGRRQYQASDACFEGAIAPDDPGHIHWQVLEPHPGPARYRMAALGVPGAPGFVLFTGGSANPYDYDGVGYDGKPAEPEPLVFRYLLQTGSWEAVGHHRAPTMDHRGLLRVGEGFAVVGGMQAGQQVSDQIVYFELPKAR